MGTMPLASKLRHECNACNAISSGYMAYALPPTLSYTEHTHNIIYMPKNWQHLNFCSPLLGCNTGNDLNVPMTVEIMQSGNDHGHLHHSRDMETKLKHSYHWQ